jgi:hypothetical protein
MRGAHPAVTEVREPSDVVVWETSPAAPKPLARPVEELAPIRVFEAHPGWRGHVEREET